MRASPSDLAPHFPVRLLGMPSRERLDDGRQPLGQKPLFLLTRLLLERRPVSRETLMAFLWPEANEQRARGSLRQALHVIRLATSQDCVAADRRSISLRENPDCDLAAFLDAVRQSEWQRAALAYGGPLLEGVTVSDATDAELWLDFQRRRMAKTFEMAATAALDEPHEHASSDARITVARRLRDYDPSRCRFWRYLLGELHRSGADLELRLERAALGALIESRRIDDVPAAMSLMADQALQRAAGD